MIVVGIHKNGFVMSAKAVVMSIYEKMFLCKGDNPDHKLLFKLIFWILNTKNLS